MCVLCCHYISCKGFSRSICEIWNEYGEIWDVREIFHSFTFLTFMWGKRRRMGENVGKIRGIGKERDAGCFYILFPRLYYNRGINSVSRCLLSDDGYYAGMSVLPQKIFSIYLGII